jgi:hypothetical protein
VTAARWPYCGATKPCPLWGLVSPIIRLTSPAQRGFFFPFARLTPPLPRHHPADWSAHTLYLYMGNRPAPSRPKTNGPDHRGEVGAGENHRT